MPRVESWHREPSFHWQQKTGRIRKVWPGREGFIGQLSKSGDAGKFEGDFFPQVLAGILLGPEIYLGVNCQLRNRTVGN